MNIAKFLSTALSTHILQQVIRTCFLLDYVISKVFVANLSMCLFAGKDIAQKLLLL